MIRFTSLLVVPVVVIAGLSLAPSAGADCTSSGGTTICAQGDSRGADTGGGPGSGPYVPYPCDYDWYCNDYDGWEIDLDADWDPGIGIGGPGIDPGPGVGLPGRPGNRPGGGRPGGGRGGGRR